MNRNHQDELTNLLRTKFHNRINYKTEKDNKILLEVFVEHQHYYFDVHYVYMHDVLHL